MARRGRFGRRRSGSTNLTALITQLLREQRAAEDRVMFDAYQNGGLVDGKPVTDARILKYIEGRRDGFSADDPLYDEWNNRLIQYKFSIGESKIQLAFRQGRVGAGAVARFYRGEMGKLDKNSAYYREVAGRAAQWAKAASGSARGSARGRAGAGLRDKLNKLIYQSAVYDEYEAALTEYAQRQGIIGPGESLTDADAGALRAMFDRGIFSGTDQITFDEFKQAVLDNYKNLSKQVDIQVALGNQGVTARNKVEKFVNETLLGLNTLDEREQYEVAGAQLNAAIAGANGDPYAVAAAYDQYYRRLDTVLNNSLAATGAERTDPLFIGAIKNEMDGIATGKAEGVTVAQMYGADNDMVERIKDVEIMAAEIDLLDKGLAYYGQETPGGALGVVRFGAGVAKNPLGLSKALQPSVSTVGGQPRIVYLMGQPVQATTIVDLEDNPVEGLSPEQTQAMLNSGDLKVVEGNTLGYVFVNPATGQRSYGVLDPATGKMTFTNTNPWLNEPEDYNGTLTVFTGSAAGRPDAAAALNPGWNVNGAPVLSDSTVTPSDLRALIDGGTLGLAADEQDLTDYAAKLASIENRKLQRAWSKESMLLNREGYERDEPFAGGGDLRSSVLDAMRGIAQTTQSVFAGKEADNLFAPPPPPPPSPRPPSVSPTPAPGPAPSQPARLDIPDPTKPITGGDGSSLGKHTADLIDKYLKPPKPDLRQGSGQIGYGGR